MSRYTTRSTKMSLDVNISEPDEFNCIELHNCIETVAKTNEIEDFTYHVDILGGKGENYIANVFRVSIKGSGSDKQSDSVKNISIIVKTLINTTRQELFRELHKREVNAYKYVIDKYNTIQDNFEAEDRVILPKCIFSSTSKNNEVIILDDLLLSGFEIDNKLVKYEKLDFLQIKLIISELAKFHALSFVFEKTDENFENVKDTFVDLIFQYNFLDKTKLKNYFQESFRMSVNLILDVEVRKQLQQVESKLLDLLKMYTEPKEYNVFCHGDCWINNMLFRNEGSTKELCFLDFQAMRYANPLTDVLYFLYICTDSEFRSEYFDELKIVYYDTFNTFLKQYNVEANSVYPRDQFFNDFQEMMPFGLLIALVELRIVSIAPESNKQRNEHFILDAEDNDEVIHGEDNLLAIRVNDVVNESVNNGVLQKLLSIVRT